MTLRLARGTIASARRLSLISGLSGLVLVMGFSVPNAQVVIDGGQTITVPGDEASPWTIGSTLIVGDTSTGELIVSSGGIIYNTSGTIGGQSGSSGKVTVTGTGSQWNNNGDLTIGSAGAGELVIENGGVVSNAGNAYVGAISGSKGTAAVSGAGSQWNVGGSLYVSGNFSTLTISDGGIVSSAGSIIDSDLGFSGIVTVKGAGSQWNMSNGLQVGTRNNGELIIADGGLVTSTTGTVGFGSGSNGSVIVTGAGSQWNMGNHLHVGRGGGTGELIISDGGVVASMGGNIGFQPGSSGSVTVTGAGSQWNNSGLLYIGSSITVGERATGVLIISDGGVVSNTTATINAASGFSSHVIVTGAGSRWNNSGSLSVGGQGNGELIISNGGIVSNTAGSIGSASDSSGRVIITGAGSQWNMSSGLQVGAWNTGELTIADGGIVSNTFGMIGRYFSSNSRVTVTGAGSQWNNSGILYVGPSGTGELIIGNGGRVTAMHVMLAVNAVGVGNSILGTGTLNIGAADGHAPVAPGVLNTQSVTFGPGEAKLVFNHTSSRYVFDATINNGADNAAGSGTGLVGDGLIEAVSGRTIINAYHGDFTGTFQIRDGGILQINHDTSHTSTLLLPGGRLEGHDVVSSLVNEGTVAPGGSIGTLTVAGNYTGSGGELHIETVLGDDASPTDRLVITGDVSGSTTVVVTNLGGEGAESADGIRIIEIGGVSPGNAFTLKGDYVTPDGQQAVIGGAYAYTLRHNSETNPSDGDWYLSSEFTFIDPETGQPEEGPRYQAGVPLYEQYPQVLAALNTVPTLQQRVGNRGWVNNNAVAAAPGNTPGTYGLWGRIEGTRTASDPARSTSMAHRDTDLWKLQTGFDFGLHQGADGSQLIGGVTVSHGTALAEIASPYGRGKVDTTGTGIGATLTWYGSHGFYVDGQAQVTWFDTDITSTTEGRKDVKGNNGHGYVLSAETGNRYQLGNGFSVTPQVQLVYSRVDFDSFSDPFDVRVSLNDGDSLRGRFGVSLDHEAGWIAQDGTRSRSHVYGIANLYNEFLDGPKVSVDTVRFVTRDERVWAGVGVGGTYEWANGAYAFYGNANIVGSVEHMSDNYAFGGTLGFRARW